MPLANYRQIFSVVKEQKKNQNSNEQTHQLSNSLNNLAVKNILVIISFVCFPFFRTAKTKCVHIKFS